MILARRLILFRLYSTNSLQQRITSLLNSVDTSSDLSWNSVTSLPTLDSAVAHLESITGSSAPPEDHALFSSPLNVAHPPPTSLLVSLCSKVSSPADAEKASHLIITYLPYVSPELRPPVLILVVHLLSTYRVLPPLERVIKLFIGLPIFHEHWHFNSLLRALTLYTDFATDGRYIARLAVLLLKTMTERELSLTRNTYRSLLQNRYITMELTEELRERMIRDKIVPDRDLLESLLRIFTHHGSAQDAATYANAILDQRVDEPPRPPESETKQIVPSTTVDYLLHLVHENSQRPQDATAEWSQFMKTGLSHRFLNKQKDTSAAAWAARLVSLSRTPSFSPESLVSFFDWSHAQRFPFRTQRTLTYTIVLRGLIRKRAYALALEVWERYRRKHGTRKLKLDLIAVGAGVEVLTRAGHPDRALALMDSLAHGRPKTHRTPKPLCQGPTVPMSLVNRFMRALSMVNPSAALQLWEHMNIIYAATPDALTFTIMLDAARHATLNGDSFSGAMQELGFDLRLRLPFANSNRTMASWWSGSVMESTTADAGSLHRARRRSYEKFKTSLTVNEGDMWGGERAWRRAHRIFTRALLAGWPALADVRAPAHAIRSSGEGPATAPLRDLKSFLAPPRGLKNLLAPPAHDATDGPALKDDFFLLDDPPSHLLPSTPLLPTHPHGAYPSFAPDDATFRAAVLLLGTSRCASQIPQTLAWMRALGVAPRVRTLAYALVFWAEVSIGAPLLERLRGGGRRWGDDGGEYVRLVRWMEDWVGAENVPDEAAVGEAMRKVDAMRRRYQ